VGSERWHAPEAEALIELDNATDKRAIQWINPGYGTGLYLDQSRSYFINHPRTVGLRLGYRF
jgi:hypothetical protein